MGEALIGGLLASEWTTPDTKLRYRGMRSSNWSEIMTLLTYSFMLPLLP